MDFLNKPKVTPIKPKYGRRKSDLITATITDPRGRPALPEGDVKKKAILLRLTALQAARLQEVARAKSIPSATIVRALVQEFLDQYDAVLTPMPDFGLPDEDEGG